MNTLYVSYDGLLDPLGASQVEPYVMGLTRRGHTFTLVTFEKSERVLSSLMAVERLEKRLAENLVRWRRLPYHRRPRLPGTLLDLWNGQRTIRYELRRTKTALIHCRGDVAMTMARWAARGARLPLLYDMRGFFADERSEVGSWKKGGALDRLVRRSERRNIERAAGIVVLTQAALLVLRERFPVLPPHRVIPTSVDLAHFTPPGRNAPAFGLVYAGSLGTWYLAREMIAVARESVAAGLGRPLFLTNQSTEAREAGATPDWADVRTASYDEVPQWLRRCRAAFFLIKPTLAKRASCPTKLGEALACGLPVLANAGVGDVEDVLEGEGVGVVVGEFSPDAVRAGLGRLQSLLAEPGIQQRCRRVAERRFGLENAVEAYDALYFELSGSGSWPSR